MRAALWLAGLALGVVAAVATWFAFSSPSFVAGLAGIAATAAFRAIAPKILEPYSKVDELNEAKRRGEEWDWFKGKPRRR